jgi:hypothetical protein
VRPAREAWAGPCGADQIGTHLGRASFSSLCAVHTAAQASGRKEERVNMSQLFPGRYTAEIDEPFVVFLIGMRVNRLFAVRKWL